MLTMSGGEVQFGAKVVEEQAGWTSKDSSKTCSEEVMFIRLPIANTARQVEV
jgi:hypothetical protein